MGDKSPKAKDKAKKQTAVVKGQKQASAASKVSAMAAQNPAKKK
jgi:hypothetical protein